MPGVHNPGKKTSIRDFILENSVFTTQCLLNWLSGLYLIVKRACLCDEGRVAVIVMSLWQVMKERYNGIGGDKMTDEFMKPIIVDKNGLVQSRLFIVL